MEPALPAGGDPPAPEVQLAEVREPAAPSPRKRAKHGASPKHAVYLIDMEHLGGIDLLIADLLDEDDRGNRGDPGLEPAKA